MEGDPSMEEDYDTRCLFERTAPADQLALENRMLEEDRRAQDAAVAKNEYDMVIENWTEHKVPRTKRFTKRELNRMLTEFDNEIKITLKGRK